MATGKKVTDEMLLKDAEEKGAAFARLQFCDVLGVPKAVEIPLAHLKEALRDGLPFDGSSIKGFAGIAAADMLLRPDVSTWRILSFEEQPIASLFCDVYVGGRPFAGDPRFILATQLAAAEKAGFGGMSLGFEPEFDLFPLDADGKPLLVPGDRAGYFDVDPLDALGAVRRDIAAKLAAMGFAVTAVHHEVGNGQNEIDFMFGDAVHACDNVQLFRQCVKAVALKHGYFASFMPKPLAFRAGNGMHDNVSLVTADNFDAFFDPEGEDRLSAVCRKFVSGVIRHARGLAALTNPTVNSYKRLVPGYEAPCWACWSLANRSAMIRIPDMRGKYTRAEIRNVDPMANPYLANAAILAAGLEAIAALADGDTVRPVTGDVFAMTPRQLKRSGIVPLPANLDEALGELRRDELLTGVLGPVLTPAYLKAKQAEWDEYTLQVSAWEQDRYLGN